MLREEGLPAEALGLGVGHWRVKEHVVEVGRQLVLAAAEAGRTTDARRTLDVLVASHPDKEKVELVRPELERAVAEAERARPPPDRPAVRSPSSTSARKSSSSEPTRPLAAIKEKLGITARVISPAFLIAAETRVSLPARRARRAGSHVVQPDFSIA